MGTVKLNEVKVRKPKTKLTAFLVHKIDNISLHFHRHSPPELELIHGLCPE